jgi:hypothetical protein
MDIIEQLLNERIPPAVQTSSSSFESSTREEGRQQSSATTMAEQQQQQQQQQQQVRFTLMESCQTTGVGVSWLNHLLTRHQGEDTIYDANRMEKKGHESNSISSSGGSSGIVLSENGKCILNNILQQHNLLEKTKSSEVKTTGVDWSFLMKSKQDSVTASPTTRVVDDLVAQQRDRGHSTLFYSLLAILQNCAPEEAMDPLKEGVATAKGDRYTSISKIMEQCARQMKTNANILCAKDVPINLDSNQTIQAALIFLSSSIPEWYQVAKEEQDIFPKMPLLWSNPKELKSGNINTAAFQLDGEIDLKDVEFVDKLLRLEASFLPLQMLIMFRG